MKLMIDTPIFDKIAENVDVVQRLERLSRQGRVELRTTHIQESEMAAAPASKRDLFHRIPRRQIVTSGMVWDVSQWDQATWDDGGGAIRLADVQSFAGHHTEDALIAMTASAACDVLVTEDLRLIKKAEAKGLKVWRYVDLIAFVDSL